MKRIIIILLLFAACSAGAQTVILDVDRTKESRIQDRGPNLKRFSHFFLRGAMAASSDKPGARIVYGTSVNLAFGIRRKFKIGSVYSLGFEIENQYTDFKMKQEEGKVFPDTIIHNKSQRIDYATLALGFYNRFNFDPDRGNFLGKFLDIGIKGEWHYSIKTITKDEMPDETLQKITLRHLNFAYNLNTSVYARLGYSHISIYASYRLLDLFKPSYNYPDMPRVFAGIDLAIF